MKIGFAASSGGHLEEIRCLREIAGGADSFLVTEQTESQADPGGGFTKRTYYLPQINRKEKHFIRHFAVMLGDAAKILEAERPDILISTGALMAAPFCLIGKLRKIKIVYIESFARIDGPSLTGKIVYPIADLFIVQWEEMLRFYPKAQYQGGIF